MPNKSTVICQAILLGFSFVFLCLTILCYSYYLKEFDGLNVTSSTSMPSTLIHHAAVGGPNGGAALPNMPAGFAIASAISMLGFAIIEANKPLN